MVGNSSSSGLVESLIAAGTGIDFASNRHYILIAAATAAAVLLVSLASPRVDGQEPPLVKPVVPFVGHIIGLLRKQSEYHVILHRKSRQPIGTLPMLNGKLYAAWDPALVAAGLRNKDLSLGPYMEKMSDALFLVNDDTMSHIRDADNSKLVHDFMGAIPGMLMGDNLRAINSRALELLQDFFGRNEQATDAPNLWLFVRQLMMDITARTLYGEEDPFGKNPDLEGSLWDFQEGLPVLFAGILPAWTAPAAYRARAALQSTLQRYYLGKHDTEAAASAFVRGRAGVLRDHGISSSEIAKMEIMLPYAATTNTVPTLFWLITFIFSRPELVAALREEVRALATAAGEADKDVTVDIASVEARCPRLMSCYRETLRVTTHQTSVRTVVRDTVLADGRGRSYLLKKGVDIHLSIATSHLTEEVWGEAAGEFDPERFLSGGAATGKTQRQAYQPFGGGHHLCPGKSFAFVEIMAVVATLLLGYDVGTSDGRPWKVPQYAQWSMVDSIHKPVDEGAGLGIKMVKKQGWERVRWRYTI